MYPDLLKQSQYLPGEGVNQHNQNPADQIIQADPDFDDLLQPAELISSYGLGGKIETAIPRLTAGICT